MSDSTYNDPASDKPLVWLHGEIKTPPLSRQARIEVGYLLRLLQMGIRLAMPQSRPMPAIGPRCHELRIRDVNTSWRVFYRIDEDAIIIAAVAAKTTRATPLKIFKTCQQRLAAYDRLV